MTPYQLVLSKVPDPIPLSDRAAKFRCVCHEDGNPSATITEGDDGKVLFHCFGCGASAAEMAAALGLEMSDLFVTRERPPIAKGKPKGYPTAWNAVKGYERKLGKPSRKWDYQNADGKVVLVVCRFDLPDGSKEFRPVSLADDGLWALKAPSKDRPLYNLPGLKAKSPEEPIIIGEGEKACDALLWLRLTATSSMNGALSPAKSDWSPCKGMEAIIWQDHDESGSKYAAKVATGLRDLDPSVRIRAFDPGINPGDDAYDWLVARDPSYDWLTGRGDESKIEAIRTELIALIESTAVEAAKRQKPSKLERSVVGVIQNYELVEVDDGDEIKLEPRPISMAAISDKLTTATNGRPYRVGDALFVPRSGIDGVVWMLDSDAFGAWIGRETGNAVDFKSGAGFHSKRELFANCKATATAFHAVEELPHHPRIDGHYYACQDVQPGDGTYLDRLIDYFSPETDIDRDLIKAMFVTIFWGGRGGTRPAFTATSDAGRGCGKTTLMECVSDLANGAIELSSGEDIQTIKSRLLSPEGISKRVALLDNVKSLRFSWAELEALITCPIISGKQMYVGEGRRPNNLTFLITLNGISLSTDLVQRCVIIKLRKPEFSGTWKETVRGFVADHRDQLIADAIGFLQQPTTDLARYSRWGEWEKQVVSRLPEPSEAQTIIRERQAAADVENEEADIIEEYFSKRLEDLNFTPASERVFIPTSIACEWFGHATGERLTTTRASRSIRQKIDEGQLKRLLECPNRNHGRGFEWWGVESSGADDMRYDIEHQIEISQQHRGFN